MCNCGKKREGLTTGRSFVPGVHGPVQPTQITIGNDVYFEYTGVSALSVKGKISGRQYRFHGPGNVQLIDYRDVPGMITIPVLRKVNRQ